MARQSGYQTKEQAVLPVAAPDTGSRRGLLSRVTTIALIVGIIAVALRLGSLRDPLQSAPANASILKAAMRSVAGTPVSTVDAAEMLSGRARTTGFQARAMSRIAQEAGQAVAAEAWLAQGLADPSSAFLSQFELCLLYWNEGERARAREACRGTIDSAAYWLNRGYEADQRGERDDALAAFQMAGSIDPNLLPAWKQTGHSLYAMKRYGEAIMAYEHVMTLTQSPPVDVFHALSRSYLELDDPAAARQVLGRGLALYTNQRVLYLTMADAYRAEGELEAADDWYKQMVQRWPNDAQVWAARGETAVAAGRLRDATGYFQEAVDIEPQAVGYWTSLATTAAAAENIALATAAHHRAMALRPDDVTLWLNAGRFFVTSAQEDEAREAFERVLVLQPDNDEAAAQLAEIREP